MNVMTSDPRQLAETEFHFPEPPNLPEELRMLREQVRRFVEKEVVPHAEAWERDGKIPREIYRRMGALGFLGMRHAAEYGGTDMGPLASMVFAEELGRSSFGGFTSSILVHTDMSAVHISLRGTPEQKQNYLPAIIRGETVCSIAVTEPDAGSDVAGLKTRARRDGDHWVINGAKMFITNAVYGDILIVAARTDRTPRAVAAFRCSSWSATRRASRRPSSTSMAGFARTPPSSASRTSACRRGICSARRTRVSTASWRRSRTSASASAASAPASRPRRSS